MDLGHIRTWIFDLDNTLYRADVSFFADIGEKMTHFISRYLAMQPEAARLLQEELSLLLQLSRRVSPLASRQVLLQPAAMNTIAHMVIASAALTRYSNLPPPSRTTIVRGAAALSAGGARS